MSQDQNLDAPLIRVVDLVLVLDFYPLWLSTNLSLAWIY